MEAASEMLLAECDALCTFPLTSLDSPSLNPCSSPHLPHVPSPLSPNYQPASVLRPSTRHVGVPNANLFQLSPKFSRPVLSPRSPLLPQYSPSLPLNSPAPFSPFENEKKVVDEYLDDVCLDVGFMHVEPELRSRTFWIQACG